MFTQTKCGGGMSYLLMFGACVSCCGGALVLLVDDTDEIGAALKEFGWLLVGGGLLFSALDLAIQMGRLQ